jgi:hypothetical protein
MLVSVWYLLVDSEGKPCQNCVAEVIHCPAKSNVLDLHTLLTSHLYPTTVNRICENHQSMKMENALDSTRALSDILTSEKDPILVIVPSVISNV